MPRTNGIGLLLLGGLVATCFAQSSAQAYPHVVGYERFHSETPSVEGGRILFNELGCVNCHDHPTGLPIKMGPLLGGVAERAHSDWIQAFLRNPSSTKPGTTMPQMILSDQEVMAVTHYLASLKPEKKSPKAFKFVNARRGSQLYHVIGCVACHAPSLDRKAKAEKPDSYSETFEPSPYPYLKEKYDIHSLSAFLFKPHDFRPQGRMPQFKLEKEDGGDLAAYLLDYTNGDSTDYPVIPKMELNPSLAIQGREIILSRNCAACHQFPHSEKIPTVSKSEIRSSIAVGETHPKYGLSNSQRQSIDLFLQSRNLDAPALTHLETLNCLACHEREGRGGPEPNRLAYFTGDHDLGDTGRYPPSLTDAGQKFQPNWLADAISGKTSIRPYLHTQMPVFGNTVHGLNEILIMEDTRILSHDLPEGDIEAGRKLLGTQGGLNCITCHDWDDRRSLGIKGLDLSSLSERLRVDWLHDYLINPASHRPNTLMPSFWPAGIASNQEILQGDTRSQIAAIYAFAENGFGLPEGFPEENATTYEIIPTKRPVVQRSFMEGVGTHALLVGYPEGIHFAIDGKTGQPAMMWKGRFFDAYATWFSRYPAFENPLGEEIIHWAYPDDSGESQYRGYRFGPDGIPEFLVELDGAVMYERLQPVTIDSGGQAAKRTIRYSREAQWNDTRLKHPMGVKVAEIEDNDPMTRIFIYQW